MKDFPLSFTDATTGLDGRIWFLAAAEATKSTYDDGAYIGAALGCMNQNLQVISMHPLNSPAKPEGICLDPDGKKFYVVTDSDDRSQPSLLLEGILPI